VSTFLLSPAVVDCPLSESALDQGWPTVVALLDIVFKLTIRTYSFFSAARRITSRDYIPSNEDILRAPARTNVGFTETYFNVDQLSLRLCHIHQQGERKKWIHQFESVNSIIFCAPLDDYDRAIEGGGVCACVFFALAYIIANFQNWLGESLVLFESIINSRWFLRTSVILFLTGVDKLKVKLTKVCCNFQLQSPVI